MEKQDVTSIEYLKDTFKIGYEAYEESRNEAQLVWDLYHNRQYNDTQLATLSKRGQPAETFNVVKLFTRMLTGYFSTVINNITAVPIGLEDVASTAVLNDAISHVLRDNNFKAEGEKIKLGGIISGLLCCYEDVVPTGEKDEYGRPHNKVRLAHVPESEIVLDAGSRLDDYSDARYIHRFKWVDERQMISLFGEKIVSKLEEHYNFTNQQDADFEAKGREQEVGLYKLHNNYLVVHSVVRDGDKTWSIFWNDDVKLFEEELTHKEVVFPYRVTKLHTSDEPEYYGIFREVVETQKAINQALIKLQLLINTQKAYVQDGAVDNLAEFTDAFNRVTAVIPVKDLKGIKIEALSREAMEQYQIIDKALDRVQRVLGINDSFLGLAYASDSGRKVKLQQNATVVALRYFTGRVEAFYRYLGIDITRLIKQYYTSHQIIRVADDANGERWAELNKPLQSFQGQVNPQTGEPVMETEFEEAIDPGTGEPMVDEEGNFIIAPIPEGGTELAVTRADIEVTTNAYNDEDEKNQLLLEQVLAGQVGQLLSQVNPSGFFKAASLSMGSMKTKNSPEIANILAQTAEMLSQNPQAEQQAQEQAGGMPGQLAQQATPEFGTKQES